MTSKQKKTPQLMRAALRRAKKLYRGIPGVVGVGLGLKHTRERGLGARPKPCVKIIVKRKRARVRQEEHIPKSFTVEFEGRAHRIPTDVESAGSPVQQAAPVCRVRENGVLGMPGTPGFCVETEDGRRFLITAGHVMYNRRLKSPWKSDGPPVIVGSTVVGELTPLTYYAIVFEGKKMLVDIGCIELGDEIPPVLRRPPWTLMKKVARSADLDKYVSDEGDRPLLRCFGAETTPDIMLDYVDRDGLEFENMRLTYAPVLLHGRSVNFPFRGGNSGGAIVSEDGVLYGMHVVGYPSSPSRSWSIAATSIMEQLRHHLQARVRILRIAANND
jgi:hypothetical protein